MKIIYNSFIPFGRKFYAVNLFGVLFAKGPCSEQTINHERIHTAQMRETLFVFFYLWYAAEWIVKFFKYRDSFKAYHNISFEREAYANGDNLAYLKKRPFFSFLKYL